MMRMNQAIIGFALASGFCAMASAAISPEEAAKLGGPEYTETGAIRAGNPDGSIPPYSGQLPPSAEAPESAGRFKWGDPYADEKPLYVVDASNMEQYADKLSDGQKLLLQRYPDTYRIEVFPTKRDISFPAHILENTPKCATTAEVADNGNSLSGAVACIPFPFPKNGYEAMWNATMQMGASRYQRVFMEGWLVDTSGSANLISRSTVLQEKEFWDPQAKDPRYYLRQLNEHLFPAAKAGSKELMWEPLLGGQENQRAWIYLPGQRRVRLAPEMTYDNVATNYGGIMFYDEISFFYGKKDRFDFSSLEMKEMIIPANSNKSHFHPFNEIAMDKHVDPSAVRWELRRVLVVDAKRKEGARHANQRKVFYIDQDTWLIAAYDSYDDSGKIHRVVMGMPYMQPELPLVRGITTISYDMSRNLYGAVGHQNNGGVFTVESLPPGFVLPDSMAGSGVR